MTEFTNQHILGAALRQSAVDLNCNPTDFLQEEPVLVSSRANPEARKSPDLPLACHLVSCGTNVVAASDSCWELVGAYIRRFPAEHCFVTPNLHMLNDALAGEGKRICFMAEYFLPAYRRQGIASALTSRLALEILARGMVPFYCAAWSNVKSVRNALRSGFRPAWVEMSAKSTAFVEKLNGGG